MTDTVVTNGRKLTLDPGLSIEDDNDEARQALNDIIIKAGETHKGEWFEVWYPGTDETNFDIVRVISGEIETLSYELTEAEKDYDVDEEEVTA